MTPTLQPGWDSCEDSQNPPIENDEWIDFIGKSMQEILDGDLEALKQLNFVSILVAPLRNSKASPKVIESVAQLFTLPLVLNGPSSLILDIKTVRNSLKTCTMCNTHPRFFPDLHRSQITSQPDLRI